MGRYYKLTKQLTEDAAGKILEEMSALENVERAQFTDDYNAVVVFTKDDEFTEVMDQAVNIFAREASCELSFDHFVVREE